MIQKFSKNLQDIFLYFYRELTPRNIGQRSISGGTGRFFSARLGLGLRKVGPFGIGL